LDCDSCMHSSASAVYVICWFCRPLLHGTLLFLLHLSYTCMWWSSFVVDVGGEDSEDTFLKKLNSLLGVYTHCGVYLG
jgi:hypothetical protein